MKIVAEGSNCETDSPTFGFGCLSNFFNVWIFEIDTANISDRGTNPAWVENQAANRALSPLFQRFASNAKHVEAFLSSKNERREYHGKI